MRGIHVKEYPLIRDESNIQADEHGEQEPGAKASTEHRVVLVDDEEREPDRCQNVLAEQEGKRPSVQQIPHERIGLLAVHIEQLEGEKAVQDREAQQAQDHREGDGIEPVHEKRATAFLAPPWPGASTAPAERIEWRCGTQPTVRLAAAVSRRIIVEDGCQNMTPV